MRFSDRSRKMPYLIAYSIIQYTIFTLQRTTFIRFLLRRNSDVTIFVTYDISQWYLLDFYVLRLCKFCTHFVIVSNKILLLFHAWLSFFLLYIHIVRVSFAKSRNRYDHFAKYQLVWKSFLFKYQLDDILDENLALVSSDVS